MCKNCIASEIGISRLAELNTAIAECQSLNVNPGTGGFIMRYGGRIPSLTQEQRAALAHYNAAWKARKDLHNDFVFDLAVQGIQKRLATIDATKSE